MIKSTAASLVITAIIGALGLGAGLIIGYLLKAFPEEMGASSGRFHGAIVPLRLTDSGHNGSVVDLLKQCRQTASDDPAVTNYLLAAELDACRAVACHVDLPRVYVVYKLDTGHINIDGKLDERAWEEVAWSESFVDIQGTGSPTPRFETKVKLRWDDRKLYVGAYLQEFAVWANKTLHDTTIYQDNSFQVLLDVAQSNHKYKEISLNALGTVADLMLTRPYIDDGEPLNFWESDIERAVYINGPINDPSRRNRFWTVEMAIPFKQLYAGTVRDSDVPDDKETWRANFVRSEWQTEVVGDKYLKRLDAEADWWVWQSPGVANIHIPDKWGLIQFHHVAVNSTDFQPDRKWVTSNALMDVYRAEKAYKAVTGRYTTHKQLLRLPPYVLSRRCIRALDIQLDWAGFRATVRPVEEFLEEGHVRTDRFLWFGDKREDFF